MMSGWLKKKGSYDLRGFEGRNKGQTHQCLRCFKHRKKPRGNERERTAGVKGQRTSVRQKKQKRKVKDAKERKTKTRKTKNDKARTTRQD